MKSEPTMAWHPESGDSKVFNHPSEVPEGWLNHHPKDVKAEAPAPKPAPEAKLPMTRKEITTALAEGGIPFNKKASDADLYVQLTDAVKAVLTESGIEFDPNADTKALLELLPKPE